ncbi:MAG: HpsJ family protein [Cyanobacteria bacterium REEB459]|nr:HpsJ family protein [Cyanobacteria bacterium REEB459]
MANTVNQTSTGAGVGLAIARIVGLICIAGFLADLLGLVLPMGSGALWRFGVLQQTGDRSIVLLFGIALLTYGCWDTPMRRKPLSYLGLGLGVAYLLTCVLVISDGLKVQTQTVDQIKQRAEQMQTQVEQSRSNPQIQAKATPKDFDNALKSIEAQAFTMTENAKNGTVKRSITIASNFLIMGIGFLSLGRLGLSRSVARSGGSRFKASTPRG